MKKKTPKKENKQIVEIHIYVHQDYKPNPYFNPNGGAGGTQTYPFPNLNPPYIVTC